MAEDATLERLKSRREGLAEAADDLERAVTSASGDVAAWCAAVRDAVEGVRDALDAHVTEVEGPEGLFADVAAESPRLLPAVERLRHDHDALGGHLDVLGSLLDAADPSVDAVREAALALLVEISRHRHRGADLLWELYDVDIGGG